MPGRRSCAQCIRALRSLIPRVRHSLPIALSFAATADRPTAVLTGPGVIAGTRPGLIRLPRAMVSQDMVLAGLDHHPLTATAALVWNGDLPRPLQQILFDAADGVTPPDPVGTGEHALGTPATGIPRNTVSTKPGLA